MTNRRNSNLQTAVQFIDSCIDEKARAGVQWLPGVRDLCRAGGFSVETCRNAFSVLAARKRCLVVPGGGTLVLPDAAAKPVQSDASSRVSSLERGMTPRWKDVRTRLSADIQAGVYPPGSLLPFCKVLSGRYGAAHTTLAQTLQSLVDEGRLTKERKRFRVFSLSRPSAQSTIVLVAYGDTLLDLIGWGAMPRAERFLHSLEQRCIQHGLRLEYLSCSDGFDWTPRARRLMSRQNQGNVLGFVFWLPVLTENQVRVLTRRLAESGRPVAVLDEIGQYYYPLGTQPPSAAYRHPEAMVTSPLFQLFNMAFTDRAGRDMGKYLFDRGHRHAVYIGEVEQEPFNTNRVAGMQRYLREDDNATLRSVWLTDPKDPVAAYVLRDKKIREMREDAAALLAMSYDSPYRSRIRDDIRALSMMKVLAQMYRDRLESTLNCREATAWVASGDLIACMLLGFLEEKGVAVPKDLSVVSFDDTPGAFNAGLTTYNFNVPALVDAMMEHILGGPSARKRHREAIEIPGFVVERTTSGPPRKSAMNQIPRDNATNR
jgi:DNA-binding LacI/PurR family transcriptional regulator/DNA-binding FadR family transcriptional regulator